MLKDESMASVEAVNKRISTKSVSQCSISTQTYMKVGIKYFH